MNLTSILGILTKYGEIFWQIEPNFDIFKLNFTIFQENSSLFQSNVEIKFFLKLLTFDQNLHFKIDIWTKF